MKTSIGPVLSVLAARGMQAVIVAVIVGIVSFAMMPSVARRCGVSHRGGAVWL